MGGELTNEEIEAQRARAHEEGQARLEKLEADPEYFNRVAEFHAIIMDGMSIKNRSGRRVAVSKGIVDEEDLDVVWRAIEVMKSNFENIGDSFHGSISTGPDEAGHTVWSYDVRVIRR